MLLKSSACALRRQRPCFSGVSASLINTHKSVGVNEYQSFDITFTPLYNLYMEKNIYVFKVKAKICSPPQANERVFPDVFLHDFRFIPLFSYNHIPHDVRHKNCRQRVKSMSRKTSTIKTLMTNKKKITDR